jgi:tetratricopeptide (TPR) repeat protein
MVPTMNFGNIQAVRAQDIVAMDIIRANINDRPIYFAVTTPDNSKIGLNEYLEMEGLAFKVQPKKFRDFYVAINEEVMWKHLMNEPEEFSKEYEPGFKFRSLSDSTIFLDENHKRLTLNYRNSFIRLSLYYLYTENNSEKALQVLDKMEEKIPRKIIPIDYRLLNDISKTYFSAGAIEKYRELAREIEIDALRNIEENPMNISGDYNPYFVLKQIYDNLGEYGKFLDVLKKLKEVVPNDPSVDKLINEYTKLSKQDKLDIPEQNK